MKSMNGVELPENQYLKDQTKAVLNMMLGQDGQPKYTDLKHITKAELLAEAETAFAIQELLTKPEPKNGKRGRKHSHSKNIRSADSKKCNMIKAIANGNMTLEEAKEIYDNDNLLQKRITWAQLSKGERPGVKRRTVTIEDENPMSGYIVAYHDTEKPC